jgi:hypothetical protein
MQRLRSAAAFFALLLFVTTARSATTVVDRADVPSGILYDLVAPIAHVERFDGSASAPAADAATLRQAVFELRRASLTTPPWPADRVFRNDGALVVRIGLVDVRYDRIREQAIASGAARVEGGRLVLEPGALETRRAFVAAPVRDYTYRGAEVTFVLDSSAFVGTGVRPARVEADWGDGAGYRALAWDQRVDAHYASGGERVVRVRVTDENGDVLHASFDFDVRALLTPSPNDTIPLTGVAPYEGGTGTGRAFVYLSPGHTQLARPVLVFEGFDIDNTMNWDELYALLNQENLVEELRARGYDAVVLDFTESTDYIQRNAFVAVDLIHKVEAAVYLGMEYPLVGASMGGLVARYALAWMEQNSDPHRVRNFISFDVPHRGANIPLGIQYWLDFFSDNSAEAAHLLERLDQPAARQMLLYHHTTPPGSTGQADPLRPAFMSELAALGDYPSTTRVVALSNGSSAGATQGFSAGAQIISYQYNVFPVQVRGDVWAVPDGGPLKIFDGVLKIFFIGPSQTVTVSGTLPWDNGPGGSRDSMAQMDAVAAPYGDIVALHPSHCFIPTVSALDVATSDPFYDVDGDPNLLANTPFANLYVPAANEPHVTVTPGNASWLLQEIDPVLVAVSPSRGGAPALSLLDAAPNPFDAETLVRWRLALGTRVRVDVFDVAGRRVTTLLDGARSAGPGQVRWTGRDAAGAPVAAGVYFVRVRAAGETQARRVVLVR